MPGKCCSVIVCHNSVYKTKMLAGEKIMYHRFPKDPVIRREWIRCSGKPETFNPSYGWVCSTHFTEEDYERNLQAELLNIPHRKKLKSSAIPSLHLKDQAIKNRKIEFTLIPKIGTPIADTENVTQKQDNKMTKRLPSILRHPSKRPKLQEIKPKETKINVDKNQEIVAKEVNSKFDFLLKQNELLIQKNLLLEKELKRVEDLKKIQEDKITKEKEELEKRNLDIYALLQMKVEAAKKQEELEQKNTELTDELASLKNLDAKNKKQITTLQTRVNLINVKTIAYNEKLKYTFTPNQMDLIFKRKENVIWTTEEITKALTIRYYSKKCYNYLKQKLNYPLPEIPILKNWSSNALVKQNILTDVFKILEREQEKFTESEKYVVLQYNIVKGTSEIDRIDKEIGKPFGRVSVVQAQGLFSDWKHIVYIDFEKPLVAKDLMTIIKSYEEINFKVLAFVGDCNSKKVWSELNVSVKSSWFLNPVTSEKIFVFADATHLLRLLRNWFLDTGFQWKNKKINIEHIETLLYMNSNNEINNFNLTSKHILCKGVQRRDSELATDMFSFKTAEAIRKYLPNEPNVLETADFIDLVTKWYGIFTSDKSQDCTFEEQVKILKHFYSEISTMQCGIKLNLIFKKSILMSINSLILLHEEYKEKYNIKKVITKKLLQDSIYQIFDQLNLQVSRHEDVNSIDCLERLKMIILGKIPDLQKIEVKKKKKITNVKQKQEKKILNNDVYTNLNGGYVLTRLVPIQPKIQVDSQQELVPTNVDSISNEIVIKLSSTTDKIVDTQEEFASKPHINIISDKIVTEVPQMESETIVETSEPIKVENNIVTIALDPSFKFDGNNEQILSILQSAGVNISSMNGSQGMEVIIKNGDSDNVQHIKIDNTTE